MGADDKVDNTAEKTSGKIKESVGDATGDKDLQAEGHKDQTKGSLKQAAENVKDAFR